MRGALVFWLLVALPAAAAALLPAVGGAARGGAVLALLLLGSQPAEASIDLEFNSNTVGMMFAYIPTNEEMKLKTSLSDWIYFNIDILDGACGLTSGRFRSDLTPNNCEGTFLVWWSTDPCRCKRTLDNPDTCTSEGTCTAIHTDCSSTPSCSHYNANGAITATWQDSNPAINFVTGDLDISTSSVDFLAVLSEFSNPTTATANTFVVGEDDTNPNKRDLPATESEVSFQDEAMWTAYNYLVIYLFDDDSFAEPIVLPLVDFAWGIELTSLGCFGDLSEQGTDPTASDAWGVRQLYPIDSDQSLFQDFVDDCLDDNVDPLTEMALGKDMRSSANSDPTNYYVLCQPTATLAALGVSSSQCDQTQTFTDATLGGSGTDVPAGNAQDPKASNGNAVSYGAVFSWYSFVYGSSISLLQSNMDASVPAAFTATLESTVNADYELTISPPSTLSDQDYTTAYEIWTSDTTTNLTTYLTSQPPRSDSYTWEERFQASALLAYLIVVPVHEYVPGASSGVTYQKYYGANTLAVLIGAPETPDPVAFVGSSGGMLNVSVTVPDLVTNAHTLQIYTVADSSSGSLWAEKVSSTQLTAGSTHYFEFYTDPAKSNEHLLYETGYTFSARIKADTGDSAFSSVVTHSTAALSLPSEPLNVAQSGDGTGGAVTVTWSNPLDWGGATALDGFRVWSSNTSRPYLYFEDVGGGPGLLTGRSALVSLVPGNVHMDAETTYYVSVQALNAVTECSDPLLSDPIEVETGALSAPAAIVLLSTQISSPSGGSLSVTWTHPEDYGGFHEFEFQISAYGDETEHLLLVNDTDATDAVVYGLTHSTSYDVTITMMPLGEGEGYWSTSNTVTGVRTAGASAPVDPSDCPFELDVTGGMLHVRVVDAIDLGGAELASTAFDYTVDGGATQTVYSDSENGGDPSEAYIYGLPALASVVISARQSNTALSEQFGDSSPECTISTLAASPAGPVVFGSEHTVTGGAILNLAWTEPDDLGGAPLLGYNVSIVQTGAVFEVATTSVSIGGLSSGATSYTARCYAVTDQAGTAADLSFTTTNSFTDASAPLNVGVVAEGGRFTISWEEPLDLGGSTLASYSVSVGTTIVDATVLGSEGYYVTTAELAADSSFDVEICAETSYQLSPDCYLASWDTAVMDTPDPPTGLAQYDVGQTTMDVEWVDSAYWGGDVAGVVYTANLDGVDVSTGRGLNASFSGLTAGQTYTLTVTAENANGLTASATASLSTVGDVPGFISFARATIATVEDAGSVTVTLTRTEGVTDTISCLVSSVDVTQHGGFSGFTDTVVEFGTGVSKQLLAVTINNDDVYTADERFRLDITSMNSVSGGLTTPNSTEITIADDGDAGLLTFSGAAAEADVFEGTSFFVLNVTREASASSGVVNATVTVSDRDAKNGVDYYFDSPATVTLLDGQWWTEVAVEIIDNTVYDLERDFRITLSDVAGGAGEGSLLSVTVAIQDNGDVSASSEPLGLTYGDRTGGMIELEWTEPLSTGGVGVVVTNYSVEQSNDAGASWFALPSDGDCYQTATTGCVLYGLDANTDYTFRVSAANDLGFVSAYSAEALISTTSVTAPSVPTSVFYKATGGGSLYFSWDSPIDAGGTSIDGYKIVDASSTEVVAFETASSAVHEAEVFAVGSSPLVVDTAYDLYLYARNYKTDTATPKAYNFYPIVGAATNDSLSAPGDPTLSQSKNTGGSVTVTLTAHADQGGGDIDHFIVNVSDSQSVVVDTYAASDGYTIYGLEAETQYTAVAFTQVEDQVSPGEVAAVIETDKPSLPTAPRSLAASSATGGAVVLEWEPPLDLGGVALLGYHLTVCRIVTGECFTEESDDDEGEYFYATGLTHSSNYTVTVYAMTEVTNCAASDDEFLTASTTWVTGPVSLPTAAGAPSVDERTGGALIVSWDPPADLGGEPLSRYDVYLNGSLQGAPTEATLGLYGLAPRSSYLVTVVAVNSAGASPSYGEAALATSDATEPGQAAPPVLFNSTGGLLRLVWDAPLDDGGSPITQYTCTLTDASGNQPAPAVTTAAAAAEFSGSGIKLSTIYSASVTSENAVGVSVASTVASVATTDATPASQPTAVDATSTTGGSVTASWGPPHDYGGVPIHNFTAAVAGVGECYGVSTASLCILYGLVATVAYDVEVFARTAQGYGASSFASFTAAAVSPPTSPLAILVDGSTGDSLSFSWSEPMDDGGSPITTYYYALDGDTGEPVSVGDQLFVTVSGLDADTDYDFQVAAANADTVVPDDLVFSTASSGRTDEEGAPGVCEPPYLKSSTTSTLVWTWDAPESTGGNDASTLTYELRTRAYGADSFNTTAALTDREHAQSGLATASRYQATVRALAGTEAGDWSDWANVSTRANVAGNVSFAVDSYSVSEDDGTFDVQVDRSVGSTGAVSVDVVVNASGSADVVSTVVTVDFAEGIEVGYAQFSLVNDRLSEPTETFPISLANLVGAEEFGLLTGGLLSTQVSVADDGDAGVVGFSSSAAAGVEVAEDAGYAYINVSRADGQSLETVVSVSVYGTTDCEDGVDFHVNSTVTLNDETSSVMLRVAVVNDDDVYTPRKDVTLRITSTSGRATVDSTRRYAYLSILDDGDTMPPVAPGAPEIWVATGGALNVTWAEPSNLGGAAVDQVTYNVYLDSTLACEQVEERSCFVGGLTQSTAYDFAVSALNDVEGEGETSATAALSTTPVTAPTQPLAVRVLASTGGYLSVGWDPPVDAGGFPVDSYDVFVDDVFYEATTDQSVDVFGLNASTAYLVGVEAVTAGPDGARGAAWLSTSAATVPGAAVMVADAETTTGGAIGVAWAAPLDTGGAPIDRYWLTQVGQDPWEFFGNEAVVSGLVFSTAYQFVVQAQNVAVDDKGAESAVLTASTTAKTVPAQAPAPTLEFATGGALAVDLAAPSDTGGVPVLAFYVYLDGNLTAEVFEESALLTRLDPLTEYSVAVAALNQLSYCEELYQISEALNVTTTAMTAPWEPENLRAGSVASGTVTVLWDEPLDFGGGALLRYDLAFGPDHSYSGLERSFTATGLDADTLYSYTVTATNAANTSVAAEAEVRTDVASVPGVPENFTCVSGDVVSVHWEPPLDVGGVPLENYDVLYLGSSDTSTVTGESFLFTDLAPATLFTFSVAARNSVGLGDSATVECRSGDPEQPGGMDTPILDAEYDSGGGVRITVFEAEDDGGSDQGFKIYVDGVLAMTIPAPLDEQGLEPAADGAWYVVLGSLSAARSYVITVAAFNSNGDGESSAAVTVATADLPTPPGAPAAPRLVEATGGSLSVAWDAPVDSGGATVTAYNVKIDDVVDATVSSLEHSFTGLQASTAYSVAVAAVNSQGTSDDSDTLSVATTAASPPSAPLDVAIVDLAADSFTVTFADPADLGGVAASALEFSVQLNDDAAVAVPSSSYSHAFTGLSPSTFYAVAVQAASDGEWSSPVYATTYSSATAMAAPVVGCVTDSSVQLSWTPPPYPTSDAAGLVYELSETTLGVLYSGADLSFTHTTGVAALTTYSYSVVETSTPTDASAVAEVTTTDGSGSAQCQAAVGASGEFSSSSSSSSAAASWAVWSVDPVVTSVLLEFTLFDLEADYDYVTVTAQPSGEVLWQGGGERSQVTLLSANTPNVTVSVTLDDSVEGAGIAVTYTFNPAADVEEAFSCASMCSDHGACDFATGECDCDVGYTGEDCSALVLCYDSQPELDSQWCSALDKVLLISEQDGSDDDGSTGAVGSPTDVDGSAGKPFATITHAMSVADADSVLLLMPGTFSETLSVVADMGGIYSITGADDTELSGDLTVAADATFEGLSLSGAVLVSSGAPSFKSVAASASVTVAAAGSASFSASALAAGLTVAGTAYLDADTLVSGSGLVASSGATVDGGGGSVASAVLSGGDVTLTDLVVVDGVSVTDGSVTMSALTVSGGGVSATSGSAVLTMRNVTITGNAAGAGLLLDAGATVAPGAADVLIDGNAGAGVSVVSPGAGDVLSGLTVSGNGGGGLLVSGGGLLTVADVVVQDNDGGGVSLTSAASVAWDSSVVVRHNRADNGAGVSVGANSQAAGAVLVHGNTATLLGGGLLLADGAVVSGGAEVMGNSAGTAGGGVAVADSASAVLDDVEVSGNSAPAGGGAYVGAGADLDLGGSSVISSSWAVGGGGGGGALVAGGWLRNGVLFNNSALVGAGGGVLATGDGAGVSDLSIEASYASAAEGGCLAVVDATGATTVARVTASGCEAAGDGGGIYLLRADSVAMASVTVFDCASTGGDGGGLAATASAVTHDNCTLFDNTAGQFGGNVMLNGTSFVGDTWTTVAGGAAAGNCGGDVALTGSSSISLVAVDGEVCAWGGDDDEISVSDAEAGALVVSNGRLALQTVALATDATFADVDVTHDGVAVGGSLVVSGETTVLGRGSLATRVAIEAEAVFALSEWTITAGGGVSVGAEAEGSLEAFGFGANNATVSGGGLYVGSAAVVAVGNSWFAGNSAGVDGGAAFVDVGAQLRVNASSFSDNAAGVGGGAVSAAAGSVVELLGCTLDGNVAGEQGGAVSVSDGALSVTDSELSGNSAGTIGGSLFADGSVVALLRSRVVGAGDYAAGELTAEVTGVAAPSGGLLYLSGGTMAAVDACELSDGVSTLGGGLFVTSSEVTLNGTSLSDCRASKFGGGVYLNELSALSVLDSTLSDNGAWLDGGTLYVRLDSSVLVSGSTLSGGLTDDRGSALFLDTGVLAQLWDSKVSGCRGLGLGSAVYVSRDAQLEIERCAVTDNGAGTALGAEGGGAVYVSDGSASAVNSTFAGNQAVMGGALFLSRTTTMALEGCHLEGNAAVELGGGVLLERSVRLSMERCSFEGNGAEAGGALAARDSVQVSASDCAFEDNAAWQGGALYVADTSTVLVSGSEFEDNAASSEGGALYVGEGVTAASGNESYALVNVTSSRLSSNSAAARGGGVYLSQSDNVVLRNCSFDANAATVGGGIFFAYDAAAPSPTDFYPECSFWAHTEGYAVATSPVSFAVGYFPPTTTAQQSSVPVSVTGSPYNSVALLTTDLFGQQALLDSDSTCDIAAPGLTTNPASAAVDRGLALFLNFSVSVGGEDLQTLYAECSLSPEVIELQVLMGPCQPGYQFTAALTCEACADGWYSPHGRFCLECPEGGLCEGSANALPVSDLGWYKSEAQASRQTELCDEDVEPCSSGGWDWTERVDRIYACMDEKPLEFDWSPERRYACLVGQQFYECPFEEACLPDVLAPSAPAEACAAGYEGVLCAICEDGYSQGTDYACNLCLGSSSDEDLEGSGVSEEDLAELESAADASAALYVSFVSAILVAALVAVVVYMHSPEEARLFEYAKQITQHNDAMGGRKAAQMTTRELVMAREWYLLFNGCVTPCFDQTTALFSKCSACWARCFSKPKPRELFGVVRGEPSPLPLRPEKFKIMLGFAQVFSNFATPYLITWPSSTESTFEFYNRFNLDAFKLVGVDCIIETGYYDTFQLTLLMLLIAAVLLCGLFAWGTVLYQAKLLSLPRRCHRCGYPVRELASFAELHEHNKYAKQQELLSAMTKLVSFGRSEAAEAAPSAENGNDDAVYEELQEQLTAGRRSGLTGFRYVHKTCPSRKRLWQIKNILEDNLNIWRVRMRLRLNYRSYQGKVLKIAFWIMLLAYPPVSTKILGVFNCEEVGDTYYLQADYNLTCFDDEWELNATLASVMIVLFVVGIPVIFFTVLYRARNEGVALRLRLLHTRRCKGVKARVLREAKAATEATGQLWIAPTPEKEDDILCETIRNRNLNSGRVLQRYGFIFDAYKPAFWWFEITELVRKVFLNGFIVFFEAGSLDQILLGLFVCLAAGGFQLFYQPYLDPLDGTLASITAFQLFLTLFLGYTLNTAFDNTDVSVVNEDFIAYMILVTNCFTVAFAIWAIMREAKEAKAHERAAVAARLESDVRWEARHRWRLAIRWAVQQVRDRDSAQLGPVVAHKVATTTGRNRRLLDSLGVSSSEPTPGAAPGGSGRKQPRGFGKPRRQRSTSTSDEGLELAEVDFTDNPMTRRLAAARKSRMPASPFARPARGPAPAPAAAAAPSPAPSPSPSRAAAAPVVSPLSLGAQAQVPGRGSRGSRGGRGGRGGGRRHPRG